jgi:hypothetical protein
MATKELLDVGEVVGVRYSLLVGVVKDLAIHDGKVTYLVMYVGHDKEKHERYFKREELDLKESNDE